MTNITMTRGDTYVSDLVIKDAEGYDYTPALTDDIKFSLKPSPNAEPILVKTIDNTEMVLTLSPTDTKELALGDYLFAIVLTRSETERETVVKGVLSLTWGADVWTVS